MAGLGGLVVLHAVPERGAMVVELDLAHDRSVRFDLEEPRCSRPRRRTHPREITSSAG